MNLRNLFKDNRPIYGQDPHISKIDDSFVLCESIDEEKIAICTLESLQNPRRIDRTVIWDDPVERQVWAPELHRIDPYWFVYYAASNGENVNHRPYVLWSYNLLGPYHRVGQVGPDIWGIDMTTFEWDNKRYAVWSGWEHNGDEFPQNLYISEMLTPWKLKNDIRVRLSVPEHGWESSIAPILEAPQAWIRRNKLSIFYSANASWKQEYCIGMLTLKGNDPLNPGDWEKCSTPVLMNAGHGCVVDDYLIYHRKLSTFPGWADREIKSLMIGEPTWTRK